MRLCSLFGPNEWFFDRVLKKVVVGGKRGSKRPSSRPSGKARNPELLIAEGRRGRVMAFVYLYLLRAVGFISPEGCGNRSCPEQKNKRPSTKFFASPLQSLAAIIVAVAITLLSIRPADCEEKPWVGNTSGPFFTGTADAEPLGSWYYEPFVFDSINNSSYQINTLQKFSVGLPLDMEFDLSVPTIYNEGQNSKDVPVDFFGPGDIAVQLKKQISKECDSYNFLSTPSVALVAGATLPTGNYQNLSPGSDGVDQSGNGTYDLDLGVEVHKQAAPFQFYLELVDYLIFPADVRAPYAFNNGSQLTAGSSLHMVDGNLFYYAAALEYVVDPKIGFGYLLEIYGETQGSGNLVYGSANAPAWSSFWVAPEVEVTWPDKGNFCITWGAGVAIPVAQSNYPRTFIPMATATFYFNSGGFR
jgi:hypothetical protein